MRLPGGPRPGSAGYDVSNCVLACYSAAGFHHDLSGAKDPRLALITLDDICARCCAR